MTDDIREKVKALIDLMDESENGTGVIVIKQGSVYQDLKAALRPSREDIADYLDGYIPFSANPTDEYIKMFNYAIEELRKPLPPLPKETDNAKG